MNYLFVRHKVVDFRKWKSGYDAHSSVRNEVGLKELHLLHPSNDPNDVVLFFEVGDLSKAQAFCGSEELRAKMQELGVTGQPEITFLTD